MKYAIPIQDGQVSMHFGQSTAFMIVDTDGRQILKQEMISTVAHNCGSLPEMLSAMGVKVVLAGGMGLAPRMAFERRGVEVVMGVTELDPGKAVLAHLSHTLVSGQNVCDHGDTSCEHQGEHHGHTHA